MIASIIAYFLCAIMFILGIAGVVNLMTKELDQARTLATFIVSMVFFVAAWGCAFIGGI